MIREKFEEAMVRRGYTVERMGLITVVLCRGYKAYHFYLENGMRDPENPPQFFID